MEMYWMAAVKLVSKCYSCATLRMPIIVVECEARNLAELKINLFEKKRATPAEDCHQEGLLLHNDAGNEKPKIEKWQKTIFASGWKSNH